MKRNISYILCFYCCFLACLNSYTQSDSSEFEKDVSEFQQTINQQYGDSLTSPLMRKDRLTFKGLDFFPANAKFNVKAKFKKLNNQVSFEMKTSTSRKPIYKKYGTVIFKIDKKKYKLTIYQNQKLIKSKVYADHLFLPFTDLTNGFESYGGGRYIDLVIPTTKHITINFNKAYNPYCCYSHRYSCPIPPKENHLEVKVNAGVKAFDNEDH